MPETEPVVVREQRGNVLVLRLNRPEARNALSPELMGELGIGLTEAQDNPDVRAVVLTGTGDRAFCSGMDLRAFAQGGSEPTPEQSAAMPLFFKFMTTGEVSVPVVGAAQATAVAGGFELLLNCDCVVASDQAQFGVPEVKRSLFAAGGGVFLANRIPLAIAMEMTLTGDNITAQRAAELGLVNKVVPADQVLDEAVALAQRIARNGPLGLAATKELGRMALQNMDQARERLKELQPQVFNSNDAKEGATAFIEKRDPVWTGT